MDIENTRAQGEKKRRTGPIAKMQYELRLAIDKRKESKLAPVLDMGTFFIALLFARCHAIFGAHPMSIAFISILPTRVWIAALGSAVGALTLGNSGIIYAMISAIVVFLRVIVSTTDVKDTGKRSLFCENLALRASAALIGGFIAAVYEALLSGLTQTTVLFGISMILLPPVLSLSLAGFFDTGAQLLPKIFSAAPIFSLKGKEEKERNALLFFQGSFLVFTFLISLSLAEYVVFGINASYIYAGIVTLTVARRFGALRAAAVGFASTLGLSSLYSAAFALSGLIAGVLFPIGIPYALIAGGIILGAWCAYAGGVSGFLATFPEYSIAALISTPIIKKLSGEAGEEKAEANMIKAEDMLGTMALSYKNKYEGRTEALESALFAISVIVKKQRERDGKPTLTEYCELIEQCRKKYCALCSDGNVCGGTEKIANEDKVNCAKKLLSGANLTKEDLSAHGCTRDGELARTINRAAAILAEDKYRSYKKDCAPDTLSLISRLIAEARAYDAAERETNEELTEKLLLGLEGINIFDGALRVFGKRRPYFIVVCEDPEGEKIKSDALINLIEGEADIRLMRPELYKKGKMALLYAGAARKYSASFGTAGAVGLKDTVSGDIARAVTSEDERYYALLSDGMGSGTEARDTAEFVSELILRALEFTPSVEIILKLTNKLVRERCEECSATVDLFTLDLIRGTAAFIKSGAAPSYIKRGSSLFRIRSRTAPLGLMKDIDAEKIKVDIQEGDYIIMLSDGVNQNVEDAPWLIDLLSKPARESAEEYANWILKGAESKIKKSDDMTVIVTKITKA